MFGTPAISGGNFNEVGFFFFKTRCSILYINTDQYMKPNIPNIEAPTDFKHSSWNPN